METVTTVLEVLAAVLIAFGAGLIYRPAGLIVAGLLLGFLSSRAALGRSDRGAP